VRVLQLCFIRPVDDRRSGRSVDQKESPAVERQPERTGVGAGSREGDRKASRPAVSFVPSPTALPMPHQKEHQVLIRYCGFVVSRRHELCDLVHTGSD
jgi:hypothetical protein